ncbi:GNAT family N-acetyltransferase [Streptomyces sp. NPDC020983]|uniref:GNAT family N-acetyltransferase n=1 Tax=Streptomyces sp. NPDC020983 TaxID=3365106 RepID=UPI003795E35D
MHIATDDLSGPEIAAFLHEHLAHMRSLSPPESTHALDLDALRAPGVTFWSVRDGENGGGPVVGCGALKALDARHAELKSMRTRPARQRGGVASLLLTHILDEAAAMGFTRLSLETGSDEPFLPARRLYAKFGFTECPPFGDYRPDPYSTFMTRELG